MNMSLAQSRAPRRKHWHAEGQGQCRSPQHSGHMGQAGCGRALEQGGSCLWRKEQTQKPGSSITAWSRRRGCCLVSRHLQGFSSSHLMSTSPGQYQWGARAPGQRQPPALFQLHVIHQSHPGDTSGAQWHNTATAAGKARPRHGASSFKHRH